MVKRKKFLIHRSSQLKFVWLAVLPALIISIFSTLSLMRAGRLFLEAKGSVIEREVAYIDEIARQMDIQKYPRADAVKIENLKKRLAIVGNSLRIDQTAAKEQLAELKMLVFLFMGVGLFCSGMIAVLLSHRVAGPMLRLKKGLDSLSRGKDTAQFKLRQYDEFKEVGESFENLRVALKNKGYLS